MAAPGYTRAAELEGLAARDWGDYVPDTVAGELAAQRRRERAANASLHQSYDEPRHIVDMAWCKWRTMEGRPEASVAITDARRKLAVLRGGSTKEHLRAPPAFAALQDVDDSAGVPDVSSAPRARAEPKAQAQAPAHAPTPASSSPPARSAPAPTRSATVVTIGARTPAPARCARSSTAQSAAEDASAAVAGEGTRAAVAPQSEEELRAQLRPIFDRFDADGSGAISIDEMYGVCQALQVQLSAEQFGAMMAEADPDQSTRA